MMSQVLYIGYVFNFWAILQISQDIERLKEGIKFTRDHMDCRWQL
jgi:hypothetical protein